MLEVGQIIKLERHKGRFYERVIVAVEGPLIYVCSKAEFERAKKENRKPKTVPWMWLSNVL